MVPRSGAAATKFNLHQILHYYIIQTIIILVIDANTHTYEKKTRAKNGKLKHHDQKAQAQQ